MAAGKREGGDVCVIPPRRNQASTHIDARALELLGATDVKVSDVHKADHSKWLEEELKILLENSLTASLTLDLENSTRRYELLELKYSNQESNVYELKDKVADLNNDKKSWQARNQQLMDKNDAHQQEIEDLLQKLQDVSQNDSKTTKAAARQLEEVRVAQRQKLADLRDAMEEKDKELEAAHIAVTKSEHQMAKLKEELKQTRVEKQRLQIDNTKLQKEASNAREVIQNKADNDGRASMAEKEVQQLQKDLATAKRQQQEALNVKREVESQLSGYKTELAKAQNNVKTARGRIDTLQSEVDRLTEESSSLRTKGGAEARSININMGGQGGDTAALQAEVTRLKMEIEENRLEFEDNLERKDRMLNEVKDALKSLGLKLGNLDSKTAIPKLKALLSILTKQVQQYKGRQRELEHLLKSRLNEIETLKKKLKKATAQLVE